MEKRIEELQKKHDIAMEWLDKPLNEGWKGEKFDRAMDKRMAKIPDILKIAKELSLCMKLLKKH